MSQVTVNAPLVVNGPVYAEGPVFISGTDIKEEIDKINQKLSKIDEKYEDKLRKAVCFVIQNFSLKEEEETALKNALKAVVKFTDWASRIQFWLTVLQSINPMISYVIGQLTLYGQL